MPSADPTPWLLRLKSSSDHSWGRTYDFVDFILSLHEQIPHLSKIRILILNRLWFLINSRPSLVSCLEIHRIAALLFIDEVILFYWIGLDGLLHLDLIKCQKLLGRIMLLRSIIVDVQLWSIAWLVVFNLHLRLVTCSWQWLSRNNRAQNVAIVGQKCRGFLLLIGERLHLTLSVLYLATLFQ